jgi:DMSO/TMAO reductase YedYZ heme-binding membrane subunit
MSSATLLQRLKSLPRNIRFWVLVGWVVVASYFAVRYGLDPLGPQYGKLIRAYALWGAGMLLLALVITPVYLVFPQLPYKPLLIKARRAIGVSAFLFVLFHAWFAFTKQLGGIAGFSYLGQRFQTAVVAGFIALLILMVMSLTSFDGMVRKLGRWWKKLHKLVYLAGVLVLFHALTIGSLFIDMQQPAPRGVLLLIAAFLVLQAVRADRTQKNTGIGIITALTIGLVSYSLAYVVGEEAGLSVHSTHQQQAKQAATLPPLTGDTTKRFVTTVTTTPAAPVAAQATELSIAITEAGSGLPVTRFSKYYEQFLHLVIVDSSFSHFAHVHPDGSRNTFSTQFTFPSSGRYHLYSNFFPFQASEQQIASVVQVGSEVREPAEALRTERTTSQEVGEYTVTRTAATYQAAQLTVGQQSLVFELEKENQPVTTLHPYLGAYGHLTLINMDTFEAVHVHPALTATLAATDRGGPTVSFVPLGLSSTVKPGVYRAFAEFMPDGVYTVAQFTITIQ